MKKCIGVLITAICMMVAVSVFVHDEPDFPAYKDVKEKKKAFFGFMRPFVDIENAAILKDRKRLLSLRQTSVDSLSSKDSKWIERIADSYNTDSPLTDAKAWDHLLERVDMVPYPLVLSQAANESAWGTSRFARQGHNFFGQWCFTKGCGIVPSRRDAGSKHEVAVFKSAQGSVRAYLKNINTGRVYAGLRKIRAQQRSSNRPLDAIELAGGLTKYSARGKAYVKEIRSMIRTNTKFM